MDLNKIALDDKKVEEGIWVEVDDTTSLLIARIGNKRFNEIMTREQKPLRRAIRNGTVPDSVQEKILVKALAGAVLLDWKGLTIDGVEVEYSKQKCIEILSDKRYKDFREFVVEYAADAEQFREELIEEAVGN